MSDKLPRVDPAQLISALKRAGFVERDQRGSHLHLWRESDNTRLTVPMHKGRNVPIGTLRAILRDANLTVDKVRELL